MKKIWTNEVRQKNRKQARMHWRTCEVRQHKNTQALLGSAPVSSQKPAQPSGLTLAGLVHLFWPLVLFWRLVTIFEGWDLI